MSDVGYAKEFLLDDYDDLADFFCEGLVAAIVIELLATSAPKTGVALHLSYADAIVWLLLVCGSVGLANRSLYLPY